MAPAFCDWECRGEGVAKTFFSDGAVLLALHLQRQVTLRDGELKWGELKAKPIVEGLVPKLSVGATTVRRS